MRIGRSRSIRPVTGRGGLLRLERLPREGSEFHGVVARGVEELFCGLLLRADAGSLARPQVLRVFRARLLSRLATIGLFAVALYRSGMAVAVVAMRGEQDSTRSRRRSRSIDIRIIEATVCAPSAAASLKVVWGRWAASMELWDWASSRRG